MSKIVYYCINLSHRKDRKEEALKQANSVGIDLHFIEAVAGSNLEYSKVAEYNRKRRTSYYEDLKLGELGCCLSHLKTYKTFLKSNHKYAVILEDDFVVEGNFTQFIISMTERYTGWEAIRLQRSKKQEGVKLATIASHDLLFPLRVGLTTTACIYTRAGAEKASKVYENFFLPADEAMKFSHFHGLQMCEVNPAIVFQRQEFSSDIGGGDQRPPKNVKTLKKLYIRLYYFIGQLSRLFLFPYVKWKFKKSVNNSSS